MIALVLCGIMSASISDGGRQTMDTEYVELIDHNHVIRRPKSKRAKAELIYEQFICYQVDGLGNVECVGYFVVRPDSVYDVQMLPKDRIQLTIETRNKQWRRIIAKSLHRSETTFDPELQDRKAGERKCLFGLAPWGDLRG